MSHHVKQAGTPLPRLTPDLLPLPCACVRCVAHIVHVHIYVSSRSDAECPCGSQVVAPLVQPIPSPYSHNPWLFGVGLSRPLRRRGRC